LAREETVKNPKVRYVVGPFLLVLVSAATSVAQSYTCTTTPCFKASSQGWIVGEIKAFAFGATGKDQMTKELLAQGWVECAGQTVPRAAPFDQLFRAIGDAWGSADGRFVFYLPDLRGSILRDWNHAGSQSQNPALGGDPDAAARTVPRPEIPAPGTRGNAGDEVGSAQVDALQDHTHQLPNGIGVSQKAQLGDQVGGLYGASPTGSVQGVQAANKSTETRPRNLYVMYAIYVGAPVTITTDDKNVQTLKAVQ
jgi:microcystin-dependent protein